MTTDEKKRLKNQRYEILQALKDNPSGLTNVELQKIAMLYGSRISELYKLGYKIEKKQVSTGVYLYKLIESPEQEIERPKAIEVLSKALEKKGYSNLAENLGDFLDEVGIALSYKKGYHK